MVDGAHQIGQINDAIDIEEAAANALLTESDQDEDMDLDGHATNRMGDGANISHDARQTVGIGMGGDTNPDSQLL